MPSDWTSRPALTRWKSGCGTSRSAAASSAIAARTMAWASSPSGSRCCGFAVRVLRSVSWRVHSWRLIIALAGNSTIHSPSSMALARTISSSAVRSATFPISFRYIRTGSSMPIMSAESASSSSAVGSSSALASSLAGTSGAAASAEASPVASMLAPTRSSSATTSSGTSGSEPRSSSSSSASSSITATAPAALLAALTALTSAAAARRRRGVAASTASTSWRSMGSWLTIVLLRRGLRPGGRAGWPAPSVVAAISGSRCGVVPGS